VLQYEEGFTRVAATIPTRSLELFAPFLDAPEPALVDGSVASPEVAR
jgi:hypothetical protein